MIFILAILTLGLSIEHQFVVAAEKNVASLMSNLQKAVEVTVTTSGRLRPDLTEPYKLSYLNDYAFVKSHQKNDCSYVSSNPYLIKRLVSLFKSSSVRKPAPTHPFHIQSVVEGQVYFKFADGSEAQFLYGIEYLNTQTIDLELNYLDMSEIPMIADASLGENVRLLTRGMGQPVVSESMMLDLRHEFPDTAEKVEKETIRNIRNYESRCEAYRRKEY